MNTEIATDQIRAHGVGVSFECDKCKSSKQMDDLHRTHISRLNQSAHTDDSQIRFLVWEIGQLKTERSLYRLVLATVTAVAILALAQDAGWFK